jgi:hypothetical protein
VRKTTLLDVGGGRGCYLKGSNPLEKGRSAGCEGKVFPEGVDPVKRAALLGVAREEVT